MDKQENNTGMRMFAAADVSHLIVFKTINTVMVLLLKVSTGDLMVQPACACKCTQAACQDSTGMRLPHNATALQRPAPSTTIGTETSVLANAIQRNALNVLTGRNHGANAETYH